MAEADEAEAKVENEAPEEPADPPAEDATPPPPPPEPEPESGGATEPAPEPDAKGLELEPEEMPSEERRTRGSSVSQPRRRSSSVKRASIDAGSRSPRGTITASSPERRSSTKRSSSMLGKSPSGIRKKFSGLGSRAKMVLGSILDIKSNAAEIYDKKSAKYQNTYKMESDNPFNAEKVHNILKSVMDETLDNLHYDAEKCASAAKIASNQIRSRVKQLEFDRYKIVCIVSIGEKNSQDVYATCRFLWDAEKDRYSFYSLENTHVYAIAYCFGLYYE